jgi:hypothetical protein|tara:strand:- start:6074 stop:6925 length:852 start_codon:yes stop_codon:yes gene_type:complete
MICLQDDENTKSKGTSMRSLPPKPKTFTRLIVSASFLALMAGLSVDASAQSFFDKAKEALGSVTGNTTGSGSGSSSASMAGVSDETVSDALRQALDKGVEVVTTDLGVTDGFNADPVAHIPLPDSVKHAQSLLSAAGLGSYGEEIELRMNRAAEQTMRDAGDILADAVSRMTLEDAKGILDGPEDAATKYLRRVSGGDIESRLRPVIGEALAETGALQLYDQMMGQYDTLPMVPDIKASLSDHATDKAMDGLFYYIAKQEADIRNDPARWTTDVLKKVFSTVN